MAKRTQVVKILENELDSTTVQQDSSQSKVKKLKSWDSKVVDHPAKKRLQRQFQERLSDKQEQKKKKSAISFLFSLFVGFMLGVVIAIGIIFTRAYLKNTNQESTALTNNKKVKVVTTKDLLKEDKNSAKVTQELAQYLQEAQVPIAERKFLLPVSAPRLSNSTEFKAKLIPLTEENKDFFLTYSRKDKNRLNVSSSSFEWQT
ncbi:MAG: hypothetical protein D6780_02760, partial [Candidatus Dadabacteria bacterium]